MATPSAMTYRRTIVLYYSGTGNSRRVAAWIADAAREAGSDTLLSPLRPTLPEDGTRWDTGGLLVLALPTHGFTAPWAVLGFTLRLPRADGTHAAVIATRGALKFGPVFTPGFEGTAALLPALILAAKGYRVRGTAAVDMPSNWTALHPSLPAGAIEAIVARARTKTANLAAGLSSGRHWPSTWFAWLLSLLLLPISVLYLGIGRFFLAKLFLASDRCTGCAICAAHCPQSAIEMRATATGQRPFWTLRCESCMRCMAFCPEKAVEASQILGIVAYLIARAVPLAAVLAWSRARVPALACLTGIPSWIIISIIALGVLVTLYPVVHQLLALESMKWLLAHTTLTRFYRRYREPHTRLRDLVERRS